MLPQISCRTSPMMIVPITASSCTLKTTSMAPIGSVEAPRSECLGLAISSMTSGRVAPLICPWSVVVHRCASLIHPATYNLSVSALGLWRLGHDWIRVQALEADPCEQRDQSRGGPVLCCGPDFQSCWTRDPFCQHALKCALKSP
jgi:hypothetical protein